MLSKGDLTSAGLNVAHVEGKRLSSHSSVCQDPIYLYIYILSKSDAVNAVLTTRNEINEIKFPLETAH